MPFTALAENNEFHINISAGNKWTMSEINNSDSILQIADHQNISGSGKSVYAIADVMHKLKPNMFAGLSISANSNKTKFSNISSVDVLAQNTESGQYGLQKTNIEYVVKCESIELGIGVVFNYFVTENLIIGINIDQVYINSAKLENYMIIKSPSNIKFKEGDSLFARVNYINDNKKAHFVDTYTNTAFRIKYLLPADMEGKFNIGFEIMLSQILNSKTKKIKSNETGFSFGITANYRF